MMLTPAVLKQIEEQQRRYGSSLLGLRFAFGRFTRQASRRGVRGCMGVLPGTPPTLYLCSLPRGHVGKCHTSLGDSS